MFIDFDLTFYIHLYHIIKNIKKDSLKLKKDAK